jgi:hypothetical protein
LWHLSSLLRFSVVPAASCRHLLQRNWMHHRPGAAPVEQNRPAGTAASRPVDGLADGWWQRGEDDFGAFSAYAQDPVAVFFAKVSNVRAGGFEDPQAEQPEHGHESEVARIRGLAGCGEKGFELQMSEPEGRRFGGH